MTAILGRGSWRALLLSGIVLAPSGTAVSAQEAVSARVSADSVAMAEVFELLVDVPVPAGSVVYFPDTVPASETVESFAPVEWRARRGPDGGATLTLTYALLPFGTGNVVVPDFAVLTVPAEGEVEGERIPGGSVVASWIDAPLFPRGGSRTRVSAPPVWVEPVYTSDDVVEGLSPRPPGDVVGFSWNWPSVALLLLFASVIGGAVVTTARDWLATRPASAAAPAKPLTLDEARRRALAELDRLLAAGPHAEESANEVFTTSSGVVRGYAERLDSSWGPELTSTELMGRLHASGLSGPELPREMGTAEAVKFGRLRPGAAATETHLRTLRGWVEKSP